MAPQTETDLRVMLAKTPLYIQAPIKYVRSKLDDFVGSCSRDIPSRGFAQPGVLTKDPSKVY